MATIQKGAKINFFLQDSTKKIQVFTTRPETIFAVNFIVLAPEHTLVDQITTDEQKLSVDSYVKKINLKSERERQAEKRISGVFTGAYAVHPFTNQKIAIWISEYVLASYGTGAVMGVPCGDQRDWQFATHLGINIINIFRDIDIKAVSYTHLTLPTNREV